MSQCIHHPGRVASTAIFEENYCSECGDRIVKAREQVDIHVEPKECFVLYTGRGNWEPIEGTGCAHWVAHQLNIRRGKLSERCLAGYTCRVRTLLFGRKRVLDVTQVQINSIYVTSDMGHVGLVYRVTVPTRPGSIPRIIIRHATSADGRIAEF